MKNFVLSIFVAVVTLILAAVLLHRLSPTVVEHAPQFATPSAAAHPPRIEQHESSGHDPPAMPQKVALPIQPAPTPVRKPIVEAPSPEPPSNKTAEKPMASTSSPVPPSKPAEPKLTTNEQMTLNQTAWTDTSLRNTDFPRTYISAIQVDLASPQHAVKLTWTGPQAAKQETGPFHSSPGRGLGNNNCDDPAESNRQDSNCTPKGTFRVQGFSNTMPTYTHCKFVTWFHLTRGVGFHSYPQVVDYPASHGCVRLDEHTAQLIHNNAKIGDTVVTVGGHWTFGR